MPSKKDLPHLIALVSLALVSAVLLWWFIAQFVNRQLRDAGRQDLIGGPWHILRFGPLAPLISAAAVLAGCHQFLLSSGMSARPFAFPSSC